jgi:hypothetical protein
VTDDLIEDVKADAAVAAGGLTNFGPDDYLPGLRTLLQAASASPHAGPALDRRVRASAAAALASRLASEAGWAARPACLNARLPPQLVVVGLPRSGTTALHQILAADPAYQWMPAWLTPRPRPRPPARAWEEEPEYRDRIRAYQIRGPNPLHDIGPADPEECLQVMQQSFVSMTWVSSQAVPNYHEWFIQQDERPSYRRYADNLRLIGADDTDRWWLLKNPSHTFGMAAMLEEFPDAVFLHIYRDPAESIVSGCSLIASMGLGEGTFTASELGAHRLRIWAMAAERLDAARAAAPPDRIFVDVDYRAFVADPVATVKDIYAVLSRPLSSEAEVAMREWAVERPMGKHGQHRYRASDFGLSGRAIRERMSGYVERYGISRSVPREPQRA